MHRMRLTLLMLECMNDDKNKIILLSWFLQALEREREASLSLSLERIDFRPFTDIFVDYLVYYLPTTLSVFSRDTSIILYVTNLEVKTLSIVLGFHSSIFRSGDLEHD